LDAEEHDDPGGEHLSRELADRRDAARVVHQPEHDDDRGGDERRVELGGRLVQARQERDHARREEPGRDAEVHR